MFFYFDKLNSHAQKCLRLNVVCGMNLYEKLLLNAKSMYSVHF